MDKIATMLYCFQVGCYVNKLNAELLASIQVDYDKLNPDKPAKKMLSLQRNAFIDKELSANETFSKKALCWFDLSMLPEDFSEKDQITEIVNEWGQEAAQRSRLAIDTEGNATMVNPMAFNSNLFANDKVIIAASSHIKIPWKNGLFYKSDTIMDASFLVSPNELHNQVIIKCYSLNESLFRFLFRAEKLE